MVQDHHCCRSREYRDVEDGLPNEPGLVAAGNRRHEVAADIVVDDVQAVDGEREGDEQGKQAASSPPHLGRQEVLDGTEESPYGYPVEFDWLFAHRRSQQWRVTATRRGRAT